jgi:hypothetical protein
MVTLSIGSGSDWMQWDLDDEGVRTLDISAHKFRHPWSLSGREVCAALKGQVFNGLEEVDGHAILFELRQPFDAGPTVVLAQPSDGNGGLQSPSDVWKAPKSAKGVFDAIKARWHDQLKAAAANEGQPLVPSGVNNQVLSEGLRDFVAAEHGQQPVYARVVYRDGSEARPFPFRTLRMKDHADSNLRVIRVSLMSMRHPEMDATVDAAWLRNRQVSLARPAAETDGLVYETSRIQLRNLASGGRICLRVYQTGLEPAVMGFYRAVTEHLLVQPRSIEVVPNFHQPREDCYQEGKPWAMS